MKKVARPAKAITSKSRRQDIKFRPGDLVCTGGFVPLTMFDTPLNARASMRLPRGATRGAPASWVGCFARDMIGIVIAVNVDNIHVLCPSGSGWLPGELVRRAEEKR